MSNPVLYDGQPLLMDGVPALAEDPCDCCDQVQGAYCNTCDSFEDVQCCSTPGCSGGIELCYDPDYVILHLSGFTNADPCDGTGECPDLNGLSFELPWTGAAYFLNLADPILVCDGIFLKQLLVETLNTSCVGSPGVPTLEYSIKLQFDGSYMENSGVSWPITSCSLPMVFPPVSLTPFSEVLAYPCASGYASLEIE